MCQGKYFASLHLGLSRQLSLRFCIQADATSSLAAMAGDRGPQLEGVLIAFLVLSVVTTSLRFYTMGFILKRFYTEDWLAVLALVRRSSSSRSRRPRPCIH